MRPNPRGMVYPGGGRGAGTILPEQPDLVGRAGELQLQKEQEKRKKETDFLSQFDKDLEAWDIDLAKGFGSYMQGLQSSAAKELYQARGKLSPERQAYYNNQLQKAIQYSDMSMQQRGEAVAMRGKISQDRFNTTENWDKLNVYTNPRSTPEYAEEIKNIETALTPAERKANVGEIKWRALNRDKFTIEPRFDSAKLARDIAYRIPEKPYLGKAYKDRYGNTVYPKETKFYREDFDSQAEIAWRKDERLQRDFPDIEEWKDYVWGFRRAEKAARQIISPRPGYGVEVERPYGEVTPTKEKAWLPATQGVVKQESYDSQNISGLFPSTVGTKSPKGSVSTEAWDITGGRELPVGAVYKLPYDIKLLPMATQDVTIDREIGLPIEIKKGDQIPTDYMNQYPEQLKNKFKKEAYIDYISFDDYSLDEYGQQIRRNKRTIRDRLVNEKNFIKANSVGGAELYNSWMTRVAEENKPVGKAPAGKKYKIKGKIYTEEQLLNYGYTLDQIKKYIVK